jgi:hypothetical protein
MSVAAPLVPREGDRPRLEGNAAVEFDPAGLASRTRIVSLGVCVAVEDVGEEGAERDRVLDAGVHALAACRAVDGNTSAPVTSCAP